MKSISTVRHQIEAAKKKLEDLHREEKEMLKGQKIRCEKCGKRFEVKEWTFLQDQWYEGPYSCMAGDCWHFSKHESCHLLCPNCGEHNHIYSHEQKEAILLHSEKEFKEIKYRWNHYGDLRGWREEAEISDKARW